MPDDDPRAELPELTRAASDVFSARRVFGEPYERNGTLVVPVAKLMGSHGVGGAHGVARMGIRGRHGDGRPGGEGHAGESPEDATSQPDGPTPGTTARSDAAPGPVPGYGPWHGGLGRSPGVVGPRGPFWPFGHGRPAGRGGGHAQGSGFMARVKPLGVYIIDDNGVSWRPALDLNRVILGGQAVAAVSVVALALALRRHRH